MILLRLLLLLVLAPFALLAKLLGFGRRDMVTLQADHPEMARAIEEARTTLPEFRRLLASPEPGMENFSVKVRFPVEGGGVEHCWVSDLEQRDSGLVGKMGNVPRDLPRLQLGSTVDVRDEDITDWGYSHNGVYQGHYTTKLLLPHLPRRIRKQAEVVYGWAKA